MLNESVKREWMNIKKSIEKNYKGKAGIYKIKITESSYIAGQANRIDKKVSSIISDLLFEKDTEASKILESLDPKFFKVEAFDVNEESIEILSGSLIDLGKPTVHSISRPKETFIENKPKYIYRINVNTVLIAYNDEQWEYLKKWYNVI